MFWYLLSEAGSILTGCCGKGIAVLEPLTATMLAERNFELGLQDLVDPEELGDTTETGATRCCCAVILLLVDDALTGVSETGGRDVGFSVNNASE